MSPLTSKHYMLISPMVETTPLSPSINNGYTQSLDVITLYIATDLDYSSVPLQGGGALSSSRESARPRPTTQNTLLGTGPRAATRCDLHAGTRCCDASASHEAHGFWFKHARSKL